VPIDDANYAAVNDVGAEAALVSAGYAYDANGLADDPSGKPLVLAPDRPSNSAADVGSRGGDPSRAAPSRRARQLSPTSRFRACSAPRCQRGTYELALAPFDTLAVSLRGRRALPPGAYLTPSATATGECAATKVGGCAFDQRFRASLDLVGLGDEG
jgi:hypothetical protein